MSHGGEVEITINKRWLERAAWLAIIIVLGVMLILNNGGGASADLEAQNANLSTQVSELTEQSVQLAKDLAATRKELDLIQQAQEEREAALGTTPTTTVPPPTTSTLSGIITYNWEVEGSESGDTYTLEAVTITIDNGEDESAVFDYTLCWTHLDCQIIKETGIITVAKGEERVYSAKLSIPKIQSSDGASLRLRLTLERDGKEVFKEEETVS